MFSETLETGTVIKTKPIGILKLIDDGEKDYKIVAVPFNKGKRTIKASKYDELRNNYPAITQIIELWFLNYNKKINRLLKDGVLNKKLYRESGKQ